jgi:KDO2-lipid IV(A) lauroyltransferase
MLGLLMKHLIGWLGRILSFVFFFGPRFLTVGVGHLLGLLWFDVFRIRRDVVLSNLAIAFPDMPLSQRIQLGRRAMKNFGQNIVEYSYLPWLNKGNFNKYFVFENSEVMEKALAKNKGVLLLTLHLGHGDLACGALSLHGYPMVLVSKLFKAKWLNDLWFGVRARLGTRFVAPRDSSFALLRALKNREVITIPLDQFTGPPIGVRSTFFGKETGTAAGMAVMASRSKAPVVSIYTWRMPDGRHGIRFERELPVEGEVEHITQTFNDELEEFVRRHPDQWMWIHKRWKKYKI